MREDGTTTRLLTARKRSCTFAVRARTVTPMGPRASTTASSWSPPATGARAGAPAGRTSSTGAAGSGARGGPVGGGRATNGTAASVVTRRATSARTVGMTRASATTTVSPRTMGSECHARRMRAAPHRAAFHRHTCWITATSARAAGSIGTSALPAVPTSAMGTRASGAQEVAGGATIKRTTTGEASAADTQGLNIIGQ